MAAILICTRLGVWQLDRLEVRRAYNAVVQSRLDESPVSLDQLPSDTSQIRFRRVFFDGVYDYDHELVLTNRVRHSSPGVYITTPVRFSGTDTALLVVRGWAYAPDGINAETDEWRESDSVSGNGFVQPMSDHGTGQPRSVSRKQAFRWFTVEALEETLPYPVFPYIVTLIGDTVERGSSPPRVPPPTLDEGPHMSYAVQWFSFALVFLVGAIFFVRMDIQRSRSESTAESLSE